MIETKFTMLLLDAQGKRTRKEFALECGISYSTLMRLYEGDTPSIKTLKKIAKCAQNHITFEDLVTEAYLLNLPHHSHENRFYFTHFSSRLRDLMEEESYSTKDLVVLLNYLSQSLDDTEMHYGIEISKASNRHYTERVIYNFLMEFEQPTLSDLNIICQTFDVSFDYLLGVTDIKTPFVQSVIFCSNDLSDSELEQEFMKNYKQLPQADRHYLFALSKALIDHYEYLRRIEDLLNK